MSLLTDRSCGPMIRKNELLGRKALSWFKTCTAIRSDSFCTNIILESRVKEATAKQREKTDSPPPYTELKPGNSS